MQLRYENNEDALKNIIEVNKPIQAVIYNLAAQIKEHKEMEAAERKQELQTSSKSKDIPSEQGV